MKEVIALVLRYEEPEFVQTLACLDNCQVPYIIAERAGYEGMSKVYDDCFEKNYQEIADYKYVWFVSNIIFTKQVVDHLLENMIHYDALHPSFNSDHAHIRPNGSMVCQEVKFIEWTAPIVCVTLMQNLRLDIKMPFWGQDLDWSFRAKASGFKIGVDYGCEIQHVYLRDIRNEYPVTALRKQVRKFWDLKTEKRLIEKYGKNWRQIIWE